MQKYDKHSGLLLIITPPFSIIGHEITHAFDYLSSELDTWSENSRRIYNERVKCIIEQYSNFRVLEIEKNFNISEFFLNGRRTLKENIAVGFFLFKLISIKF